MDDEKKAHSELGLPNPYLNSLDGDFLYHLGYSSLEARNGFTKDGVSHSFQDVKVGAGNRAVSIGV